MESTLPLFLANKTKLTTEWSRWMVLCLSTRHTHQRHKTVHKFTLFRVDIFIFNWFGNCCFVFFFFIQSLSFRYSTFTAVHIPFLCIHSCPPMNKIRCRYMLFTLRCDDGKSVKRRTQKLCQFLIDRQLPVAISLLHWAFYILFRHFVDAADWFMDWDEIPTELRDKLHTTSRKCAVHSGNATTTTTRQLPSNLISFVCCQQSIYTWI